MTTENEKENSLRSRDIWTVVAGLGTMAIVFFATVTFIVNPIGNKVDALGAAVRSEFKEMRKDNASFTADVRERLKGVETKLEFLQK